MHTNTSAIRRGFTLIELLVVVAIIGILSAISIGLLHGPKEKSNDAGAWVDINHVRAALTKYYQIHRYYPGCINNDQSGQFPSYADYHCINESWSPGHSVRPFHDSIWAADGPLVTASFLIVNFGDKTAHFSFYRYTASNFDLNAPKGEVHGAGEQADAYALGFETNQHGPNVGDYKLTIDSDGQVTDMTAANTKMCNCTKPVGGTPGNCRQYVGCHVPT